MFKVPSEFLLRLREPLDWVDLKYAYENGLIGPQFVIDFACRQLSETDCADDDVLAIASAAKSAPLSLLIERVTGIVEFKPETVRKWALILAAFIGGSDAPHKLDIVREIYTSFDYPEELAEYVNYMPMNGPDLGSVEANENRALESLKNFSTRFVAQY
jgi:hypothetical protein